MKTLHRKNNDCLLSLTVVFCAAVFITFVGTVTVGFGVPNSQSRDGERAKVVTFNETLAPILTEKCSPCHFEGGKVFDLLPFNRYETVRTLGKKLNTRLKGGDADLVNRWVKNGSPEQLNGEGKKK